MTDNNLTKTVIDGKEVSDMNVDQGVETPEAEKPKTPDVEMPNEAEEVADFYSKTFKHFVAGKKT